MADTAIAHFDQLISGALSLNPEAFQQIQTLPRGSQAALAIALMAGFSQAIGQIIVLFVNRVRPLRFVLSLLLSTLLFVFSYAFWALSTWLAEILLFRSGVTAIAIFRILGLSYAPLLFSFLVAIPYLGVPISTVLSIWSLLAFLVGLKVALGLGIWQAFLCGAVGWSVFEGLQRTIGRPFSRLGRWLANRAAGVSLVTSLGELEQVVGQRVARVAEAAQEAARPNHRE